MDHMQFILATVLGSFFKSYQEFKIHRPPLVKLFKAFMVNTGFALVLSYIFVNALISYYPNLEGLRMGISVLSGAIIVNVFTAIIGLDFSKILKGNFEK